MLEEFKICIFSFGEISDLLCLHQDILFVRINHAQHSVHPTSGSLRGLGAFFWLRVFSTSQTLSTPAHLRVTQSVGQLTLQDTRMDYSAPLAEEK